jgi:putative ABC transport system permease protein
MGVGMFRIAYKRLWGRPWLALMSVLGIALAVGLAVSVPIFAQAVSRAIMEDELDDLADTTGRPPLSIRVYFLPTSRTPVTAQQCLDLSEHLASIFQTNLGIPVRSHPVTIESGGVMLKRLPEEAGGQPGDFLANGTVGFLTGIERHMETVSGEPMAEAAPTGGDVIDVWMHESWAMEMGILAGDRYLAQPILQAVPINIRVAGTWLPKDASDPFWPSNPDNTFRTVLIVRPEDYTTQIEPRLGNSPVGTVSWAINLDENRFVPEFAERYVAGFQRAIVETQQTLPESRCDVSPVATLEAYLGRRSSLTVLLFGFSVPIIGFLLYFLSLVSNILVDGQRQVTAIMVSRGMGPRQLFLISLFEGLILLALGTPLGVLTGLGAARLMGHSSSFMRFVGRSPLHVTMAGVNLWLVLLTMGVSLVARLWPTIREQGRWSVVEFVQESGRPQNRSFWQRFYLDFLLVIPTAYAYRQLQQQGSIVLLGWKSSGDIFRDPLLFIVPALFMLTASLLCARAFPLVMRIADRFISGHLGLVSCLTVRQLGRQGRHYVTPLLLIMASLSVGVFMASMAASLDSWLVDRLHYRLGSDIVFQVEDEPEGEGGGGMGATAASLIPLNDLLAVEGVTGATWVGDYRAQMPIGPDTLHRGRFLAVDRVSFPSAASFRPDFSTASLGNLMNQLAAHPDGILVSRHFLEAGANNVGDPVKLMVSADGTTRVDVPAVIVGVFDYFPTVYEEDTPAVVGNLDYLTTVAGGVTTYDMWLKTGQDAPPPKTLSVLVERVVKYLSGYHDVRDLLAEELEKKERIGVYGTLTIGFLACLALSGVGLLIQYHKSLQERLLRFAILRAIGISRGQMVAQVQLEYLSVLSVGVLAGVFIGMQASRLFIPFFRVSTPDGSLPLPPLKLLLDQHSTAAMAVAFALLQIVAQAGLIRLAMRTELFQVLRMGHQE